MTSGRKAVNIALWGLAVLALIAVVWLQFLGSQPQQSITDTLGHGDYRLTATDGTEFTQDTLKGAPSAVFFGFTHCPEVCPTTLGDVATWQEDLATDGNRIRVYFVTVDPERDTTDVLREYVSWTEGVTGVSGSREEIDKAIAAFRIFARKVPLDDGDYTMDHSSSVLLFDENGKFFEPIGYQESYERALSKIRRLLKG